MPELDDMVRALYEAKEDGDFEPSPWEDSFIDDVYEKVDEKLRLTEKQAEKIEELYGKHCA